MPFRPANAPLILRLKIDDDCAEFDLVAHGFQSLEQQLGNGGES